MVCPDFSCTEDYRRKHRAASSGSWYEPDAEFLLLCTVSLLKAMLVEVIARRVMLVENVVICCYQDVSGKIFLQNFKLNGRPDSA